MEDSAIRFSPTPTDSLAINPLRSMVTYRPSKRTTPLKPAAAIIGTGSSSSAGDGFQLVALSVAQQTIPTEPGRSGTNRCFATRPCPFDRKADVGLGSLKSVEAGDRWTEWWPELVTVLTLSARSIRHVSEDRVSLSHGCHKSTPYKSGFGWSRLDGRHRSERLWWFHADLSGCLATYL